MKVWSGRVRSSILERRIGKVFLDILVVPHSDGSQLLEAVRPFERWVVEVALQNEQLSLLLQRVARLNQRSRRFAGLHDDRRFCQSRHGDVALREEDPVLNGVWPVVPDYGNLADYQETLRDLLLKFGVLPGVPNTEWRPDHCYRSAPELNSCDVSNGVDSLRKAGNYGEIIVDKAANESSRSSHGLC